MKNENQPFILIPDIDQTLAGGIIPAHMRQYNEQLGLGMSEEAIQALADNPDIRKTFDVPEIIAYRKEQEQEFQLVRAEIRTSPKVHLDLTSLPGSVNGIQQLLAGPCLLGGYYTVRPEEVKETTTQWLNDPDHQFPSPEKVVICKNHQDKLEKILEDFIMVNSNGTWQTREDTQSVILIDDSLPKLVEAAQVIAQENPELAKGFEHLVIVGFGFNEHKNKKFEGSIYPDIGLRTLVLPSWQNQHLKELTHTLNNLT